MIEASYVNILVHGLFFMEFTATGLTLTAPPTRMHLYRYGRGGFLCQVSDPGQQVTLDFTNGPMADLAPGKERSFANHPEVPQFSKNDAATGDIRGAGSLRILLPYPDQIIPLRCGSLTDFAYVTKPGAVRDSILESCQGGNDQFALATCLRFSRKNSFFGPTTSTYSFYAEHDHEPPSGEVNQAYYDSRPIFASGRFDLELNDNDPQDPDVDPDENPGYGILPEEEYSLAELIHGPVTGHRAINVANCVQFGINP